MPNNQIKSAKYDSKNDELNNITEITPVKLTRMTTSGDYVRPIASKSRVLTQLTLGQDTVQLNTTTVQDLHNI